MSCPPILTPDEWAHVQAGKVLFVSSLIDEAVSCVPPDGLPKLAAITNYELPDESPYKVTRADVESIELLAEEDEYVHELRGWKNHTSQWRKLSGKLAALLPPD